MPEDDPQSSKNPFIRFRQHVDARIGSGLSLLTGGPGPDRVSTTPQPDPLSTHRSTPSEHTEAARSASGLPSSTQAMSPGPFDRNVRTTTEYWNDWAQSSPYSPYNLRHLPQPVPNDLPTDVAAGDGHLFGYEDAFEDLLAAAADQPLMDLRKHVEYKRIVARAFRHGEEPTLFWANRLVNRGLLQNPLPAADLNPGQRRHEVDTAAPEEQVAGQRPGSVEQWFAERRRRAAELELQEARRQQELFESRRNDLFKQFDKNVTFNPADFVRQVEQMAQEFTKEVCQADLEEWKKDAMKKLDKDFTFNIADIFREVKQVAEDFKKDVSEVFDLDAFLRTDDDKTPQRRQQPASEDDLFSAIESAVADADTSFRNFAKAMTGDTQKNEDAETSWPAVQWAGSQKGQAPQTEVVTHDESHGKTIKSTTQHVDMFGYVHQKTEIRTLDKDGNEVSRESRYTVHPSSDKENQALTQAGRIESSGVDRQDEKDEKDEKDKTVGTTGRSSGWFWR